MSFATIRSLSERRRGEHAGGLRQLRLVEATVTAPPAPVTATPATGALATPAPAAASAAMTERRPGGRQTLDDVLVGAWESLSAHHTVFCPVCHGAMSPRYGAGPGPVGGRCAGCDTTLG